MRLHALIESLPQLASTCMVVIRHLQVSLTSLLPSGRQSVPLQRVNFNRLNAGALRRLGQFYNVPEVQCGSSLNELAYAVANAFTQEVRLFRSVPQL